MESPNKINSRTRFSFSLLALIFILGCSGKPDSLAPEKYFKWIADEENGLANSKKVRNVTMRARLLPSDFLAYKEYSGSSNDSASFDSLRASYACGLTFQFVLEADKQTNKEYENLLQYEVADAQEFAARTRALSFNIQDFITLRHGTDTYAPVLSQYEGYDAIGNKISFQVVFDIKENECGSAKSTLGDVTLIFDDPFWNLGVNNFLFEKNNFGSIPKLIF
jgi:hypothetical protein